MSDPMQSCPPAGEIALPMGSECVDNQKFFLDAIVPFTKLTTRIPECVDELLAIS